MDDEVLFRVFGDVGDFAIFYCRSRLLPLARGFAHGPSSGVTGVSPVVDLVLCPGRLPDR